MHLLFLLFVNASRARDALITLGMLRRVLHLAVVPCMPGVRLQQMEDEPHTVLCEWRAGQYIGHVLVRHNLRGKIAISILLFV